MPPTDPPGPDSGPTDGSDTPPTSTEHESRLVRYAKRRPDPLRFLKRIAIAIIGGTVILVGVVMIVTPGPALVVIPAGLAILATEFIWARRLLKRVKRQAQRWTKRANRAPAAEAKPPDSDNGR